MTIDTAKQMIPQHTKDAAKQVSVVGLAERYTTLHKEAAREWAGPCPKCGGDDRFHCTAEWFFCRQCHSKPGDSIEFVRWMQGVGFADAVGQLTGSLPTPETVQHRKPAPKPKPPQDEMWSLRAAEMVNETHEWLMDADEAEPGRAYLRGRGLECDVWVQYRLGYLPQTPTTEKAAAIVIPWYADGKLRAVRFRFLETQDGTRLKSLDGSQLSGLLFGGQALPDFVSMGIDEEDREKGRYAEKLRTLVIVEGELNAMSIWTVAHDTNLDVLSLGSESATITDAMVNLAKRYGKLIVWFDKKEKARANQEKLEANVSISLVDGRDANDLLKAGELGLRLSVARLRACKTAEDKERLLWDLWDAANTWMGVDDGTAEVVTYIARELGKTARVVEVAPGEWRAAVGSARSEAKP